MGGGTATFGIDVDGPVQFAVLYWAGRDRPCAESGGVCVIPFQPYKDQVVRFESTVITGTVVGTEQQNATPAGRTNNVAYLADVTSLVQAKGLGSHTFAFSDGDHALDLDVLSGASLIVGFTSPSDTTVYRLQAYHGLDFAHGDDPTAGASRVTAPITVAHDAAFVPRIAELTVIAGSGTAARADRIAVAGRGSTTGCLSAADGEQ